ncbi:MAG: DUF2788 domain-containing protein [Thiotrichales bacterium]
MTEAEFSSWSLKIGLTLLIGYMIFIIYRLGRDSQAGKFGMFVLFLGLGTGMLGFVAKEVIRVWIEHH